jgi:LysM repeat protein
MKSLWLGVIVLLGLIVLPGCHRAQAAEVTATGYGSSFNESLQNAKVLATEYVASTFITGKQELTDGKYKETLGQYNGGLVQKYVVKNTVVLDGMYQVTILADVDTDKVNKIVADSDVITVATPQVLKAIDEYNKTTAAWLAINQVSNPFVITIIGSKYVVSNDRKKVNGTYYLSVTWNPKWIDDAKQLVKSIDRSPIGEPSTKAICFKQKVDDVGNCFGVLAMPDLNAVVKFNATIHHIDGTTETRLVDGQWAISEHLYSDANVSVKEPGWFKPIRTDISAVTLYEQETSRSDLPVVFNVDEFKTVLKVTFAPVL